MEYSTLFELELPFNRRAAADACSDVRAAFAALTEQAFPLLSARKLEFDDVILEHLGAFIDSADPEPAPITIMLPTLSHPDSWLKALNRARADISLGPCSPQTTRLERLILRTVRELNAPVPSFLVRDDYSAADGGSGGGGGGGPGDSAPPRQNTARAAPNTTRRGTRDAGG